VFVLKARPKNPDTSLLTIQPEQVTPKKASDQLLERSNFSLCNNNKQQNVKFKAAYIFLTKLSTPTNLLHGVLFLESLKVTHQLEKFTPRFIGVVKSSLWNLR
jgi:hypothetical protein